MHAGAIDRDEGTRDTGRLRWVARTVVPRSVLVESGHADFRERCHLRDLVEVRQVLGCVFDKPRARTDRGRHLVRIDDVFEPALEGVAAIGAPRPVSIVISFWPVSTPISGSVILKCTLRCGNAGRVEATDPGGAVRNPGSAISITMPVKTVDCEAAWHGGLPVGDIGAQVQAQACAAANPSRKSIRISD
jgi:hypothetical protein